MNERWKDLIKQAIQEIGPEDNPSKEETLKRYAELIVRECVQVSGPEASDTDEWFIAKVDSVQKIKEHFGLNGMSTEDKKTLIKELLGVKND